MNKPKQSERRELWRQRIAAYKVSGQSVRVFCREQKLTEHSFYWWRRQFNFPTEKPVRFALVKIAAPTSEAQPLAEKHLELVLNSGERLRIPAEAAVLRLVLSVVREHGQAAR